MDVDGNVSPMLKAAIKDVEKVLQRFNIGGVVILCDGQGHGEWRLFIDTPTWSMVRFVGKNKPGIHFKGYMKSRPEETERTTNMLFVARDILARSFLMIDQVKQLVKKHLNTEEGPAVWTDGGGPEA